jgi:hypothetical protein
VAHRAREDVGATPSAHAGDVESKRSLSIRRPLIAPIILVIGLRNFTRDITLPFDRFDHF